MGSLRRFGVPMRSGGDGVAFPGRGGSPLGPSGGLPGVFVRVTVADEGAVAAGVHDREPLF